MLVKVKPPQMYTHPTEVTFPRSRNSDLGKLWHGPSCIYKFWSPWPKHKVHVCIHLFYTLTSTRNTDVLQKHRLLRGRNCLDCVQVSSSFCLTPDPMATRLGPELEPSSLSSLLWHTSCHKIFFVLNVVSEPDLGSSLMVLSSCVQLTLERMFPSYPRTDGPSKDNTEDWFTRLNYSLKSKLLDWIQQE